MIDDRVDPSLAIPASPYVGLGYYTEERANVFFGRDAERKVILTNLRATRLTLLYAQSGVGKSSLLRAGVMPGLREAARTNLARRGHATHIPVLFSSWRDDPVEEFRSELQHAVREFWPEREPLDLPTGPLSDAFSHVAKATNATVLVILDQFEEYFLYRSGEQRPGRFAQEVADTINTPGLRANFLIAVREDAYAGLGDTFGSHLANVYGNYLHLEYLDRDAARQAIAGPIEHVDLGQSPGDAVDIEPELIDAVLDQVRTGQVVFEQAGKGAVSGPNGASPSVDEIETPYLQLVMTTLWKAELGAGSHTLRRSTLERLGGAQEIVRTHLDHALGVLSDEQRELAVDIFDHLVTPSGTKVVHRVSDLAAYSGRDPAEVEALVERLAGGGQRILRPVPAPPGEDGPPRVEIFHDVLAPAILAWRTAQTAERLRREKQEAEREAASQRRRARTFRAIAAVVSALLIAAIAAVVVGEAIRARNAQHVAQSRLLASQAGTDFQLGKLDRGVLLSIEAYRTVQTAEARGALAQGLYRTQGMVAYFADHTGAVSSVSFSPDGRTIASASADDTVTLRDIATGTLLHTLRGYRDVVTSVAFAPDGRTLATASLDGTVGLWNVATGTRILTLHDHAGGVWDVAFGKNGTLLASAGADGTVVLTNPSTGRRIRTLRGHAGAVYDVAFNPAGTSLASAGADHTVRVWNVATGRTLHTLRGHTGAVNSVAFGAGGRTLATAGADGTIRLWDAATGRPLHILRGHRGAVNSVVFSPGGDLLASAGNDHRVGLWNAATGQLVRFLPAQAQAIETVAFSPGGSVVASGGDDGSVVLWTATPPTLHTLNAGRAVLDVAFSPDGRQLASATAGGFVFTWDAATGRPIRELVAPSGDAEAVAFSPDGRMLAAGTTGGRLTIWDPNTGRVLRVLAPGAGALYSVAFSPDGRMLAAASADGSVLLWDARTGVLARRLSVDTSPLYTVAFSPDGRLLASAGADDVVTLWDLRSGRRRSTLSGHLGAVEALAFNPTGNELASGSDDHTVILWNVRTGDQLGDPLRGHQDAVVTLAFGPGGKALVSGSRDGTVFIWDVADRLGVPLGPFPGAVDSVALGSSRPVLAVGSSDGTVALLSAIAAPPTGRSVQARLCSVVRRSLTGPEWHEFLPNRSYRRTCPGYA